MDKKMCLWIHKINVFCFKTDLNKIGLETIYGTYRSDTCLFYVCKRGMGPVWNLPYWTHNGPHRYHV